MRHHERAPAGREPRAVAPRSAAPELDGGPWQARLVALQRTLGNAAAADWVRRSRGEAVQRAGTGAAERTGNAAAAGHGAARERAGRDGVEERERRLSEEYGIRIGPPPGDREHFTHAELDRIDTALATLPSEDLGPNEQLVAIEPDPGGARASAYDEDERTIGIVRPILAGGIRAPGWLYARLNRGSHWQRRLMDHGALSGMSGVGLRQDHRLGIRPGRRHVMAGVSDELAHGNLLEWTVRHEVGHSVDAMVEWSVELAAQERFGGWRVHGGDADGEVARAVLRKADLLDVLGGLPQAAAVSTLSALIRTPEVRGNGDRLHAYFERFKALLAPPEFERRRDLALRFVRLALAQPWSLDDGGATVLDVEGRTYHVDQYDDWVSYSTAQRRAHALSNYQFSTPKEWFAEAYAACYDPEPGVGDRLPAEVRAWFEARRGSGGSG
ncbi:MULTISPECIES: hypothetical protein [unclassified Saccharopolyspora]|uniref:hypothetical protein n=1 Tax=unclassified Saccharopolyspora TaxID=2646250 RepID=UPI001CD61415|nr:MULTISPECIES: hypothetical protein [unclassified Saccharopolyspora]MCA1227594.1 hypothetical protein [Saccharopolyspora sp. 6M]MCA1281746.1 hypothetical protein [Saccharopolyspora sp. 7B]